MVAGNAGMETSIYLVLKTLLKDYVSQGNYHVILRLLSQDRKLAFGEYRSGQELMFSGQRAFSVQYIHVTRNVASNSELDSILA